MHNTCQTKSRFCDRVRLLGLDFAGHPDFVHLYLEPPSWDYTPGQFVMLRPEIWVQDPIWPRPFSICEKTPEYMRIFVQVVGRGTSLLSSAVPDSEINMWGPLGRGFRLSLDKRYLILAGGMGIAPFVGLCKEHPYPGKLSLIFGHRMDRSCYPFDELPGEMQRQSMRQTNQEDMEHFGRVLQEQIARFAFKGEILACGPMPFLQVVHKHVLETGAPAQLSVETRMACGVGACLGCVVETRSQGLVQSCVQGPVFDAGELVL
ncbi:dihydroorotate dehydrogenase electron transfer subunit [Desulfonatronospira sp.]|uniref:iron-sulfur cluster-binding protein n=1 Tax=Desulfonatronospira sp. TaxID=1962951 RepID=UPI0025BD34ED|nr:dihydroorotate dehydrogenase electron transfer subunit [Desulfonatronospira sp.]